MVLSLAACSGNTNTSAAPQSSQTQTKAPETNATEKQTGAETTPATGATEATGATQTPAGSGEWETKGLPAIEKGVLSGKSILLTSVGQSADVDTVATLLKRAKIDYTQNNTVAANSVTANNVLVLVVGGSSKGLGGAGLDQEKETARVSAILDKAKELNVTVICMHTGGTDRRGNLSDAFINLAFPAANYAIIEKSGDADNLIHDILAKNNVPTAYIEKQTDSRAVLEHMFK